MRRSVFARVLGALQLSSGSLLRLSWREQADLAGTGVMSRVFSFDAGALRSGTSTLTLTVRRGSGAVAAASTVINRN